MKKSEMTERKEVFQICNTQEKGTDEKISKEYSFKIVTAEELYIEPNAVQCIRAQVERLSLNEVLVVDK